MSDRLKVTAEPLQLRIEKPIYGGAGLARHEGKAIFTPYTLPGEFVTATVTHSKSTFAEASLDSIQEASPDRATAPCPYFGRCGGCHYQHAAYAAQVAIKATILEESLTRAGLLDLPAIMTHAGEAFGYRNRIRLHLDPSTSAPGYRERASHRLLPVNQCPIAAPELQQALDALGEVSRAQACGTYFSQAEFSMNQDGSELLLALWTRQPGGLEGSAAGLERLCAALQPSLPALRGAGIFAPAVAHGRSGSPGTLPQRRNASSFQRKPFREERDQASGDAAADGMPGDATALWGEPRMTYKVLGLDYRVSLGAFFQVNRTLIETLVSLATEDRSGALAWDLYAGVGLFSRLLARQFDRVVAVEGSPVSSEDLRFNLAAPHRPVRASTIEFLRGEMAGLRTSAGRMAQANRPDFVLVDPPRAGLGEEVTRLLSQIGPAQITYVSCDPATLSRDLRSLVDLGYKLQQLHLVDLFPQTFHLETVAKLSRR